MKRNIFLMGICIASAVLFGEITYYTYKIINNRSEKVTYDQNKEKPNEIDNSTSQEEISEDDISKYLNYVPTGFIATNLRSISNAYERESVDVNTFNQEALLGFALTQIVKDQQINDQEYTFDNNVVNEYLERMYNLNLDSYNLKDFNIRIDNSFFKNDRDTISGTLAKAEETTQIIPKSYELDNDNLIIYSYAIRVETADTIRDIGTFLEHHLNNSITDTIKANEDKFTLYKHTFKKGINKEYYWYSTENINDLKFSKTNVVTDNKDNRSLGKEITLIPDIKAKTLDMTISNLTVWNKIVFVASKTLDIPMECYEIASQNCYYSLEEIKDNYIKYFGENDYNNTVKILNTYKFQNDEYASFKNGKFYFFTGSLPANANYDEMGPKSYAVLVNKAITIDNKIEVYVYYTNIAYINNDNKTKIVLYADYDGNEIISESAYYTNDNINLESIADQEIKNNQDKLPIYKYVLLKENDNYYFDHIERVK